MKENFDESKTLSEIMQREEDRQAAWERREREARERIRRETKLFLVASNTAVTAICRARTAAEAEAETASIYRQYTGEERDDWEAYELDEYMGSVPLLFGVEIGPSEL